MRVVPNPARAPSRDAHAALLARVRAFDVIARGKLQRARALSAPSLASRFQDGSRAWILDESGQETGSFKVRGALFMLAELGASCVVAASAGNHGAGVAYAARALGVHATIFVPKSAPEEKKRRIAELGAELVIHPSEHYDDAEGAAKDEAERAGVPFVSPYEDDRVAAGNGATLAEELLALRVAPELPLVVVCPFGGGGLACGLAWGLEHGARDAIVWGAQSEASPAMALSLAKGRAETRHEGAPTLADGLEGGIAEGAYARARACVAGVCVVEEDEIARAMAWLFAEHALRVEGSAAVGVAALLASPSGDAFIAALGTRGPVEIVFAVTGRNVDAQRFDAVLERRE